jgi:hypothetical protein
MGKKHPVRSVQIIIIIIINNSSITRQELRGKSKGLCIHSHKYYPIKPKIPYQHYHGNGYNNRHIHDYHIWPKIPQQQAITNEQSNRPTLLTIGLNRDSEQTVQILHLGKKRSAPGVLKLFQTEDQIHTTL